ncbi:hypothetical protein [Methylomonas sp. AM2-LC]|uniref:hypothetical protein n=1 Tax=Methylomonas sp. AM2-LC TaxID=3153301 RepID=UPI003264C11D
MQKTDDIPMWVFLALSSIETRKGAMLLIFSNVLFSAYCVPWVALYPSVEWVTQLFLIEDWEWFLMSAPMNIWYWFSVKWVDKNRGWQTKAVKAT